MAEEILRSKHGFGTTAGLPAAIEEGKLDAFDLLFLDPDTDPKIGWIDKNGKVIIPTGKKYVSVVAELPEAGDSEVIYIYNAKLYFWDGEKFISPEGTVSETVIETKVEEAVSSANAYTDAKLEDALGDYLVKKYEISHKPNGTIVDYRGKEIRVMCAANTEWVLQNSGANAEANKYYIGFKAYAPSDDVVSFKEDLAKSIADETMYYFEGNEFAGVEEDGRKYSIVWLPAAVYENGEWTYYGAKSTEDKYIGWHYSVEWYNADGVVVASDCIRINLTNEACHSSIKPFYLNDALDDVDAQVEEAVKTANAYTDEQIAALESAYTIVEF